MFTYDAENRIKQVQNTATQATANYQYDGQGKRVKKTIGTQETYFVYDAFGKLVAEYTVNQTITQNGTQYMTADALGSPRVVTSAIGAAASRHDYMPFGEEVLAGTGGRAPGQGYGGADNARQKFTGYERDTEINLDFAQARYYNSAHGRFTSVDPTKALAPVEPQSWNKYTYTLNSPLKFVDRDGNWPTVIHNLIFLLALPGLTKEEISNVQEVIALIFHLPFLDSPQTNMACVNRGKVVLVVRWDP